MSRGNHLHTQRAKRPRRVARGAKLMPRCTGPTGDGAGETGRLAGPNKSLSPKPMVELFQCHGKAQKTFIQGSDIIRFTF